MLFSMLCARRLRVPTVSRVSGLPTCDACDGRASHLVTVVDLGSVQVSRSPTRSVAALVPVWVPS